MFSVKVSDAVSAFIVRRISGDKRGVILRIRKLQPIWVVHISHVMKIQASIRSLRVL